MDNLGDYRRNFYALPQHGDGFRRVEDGAGKHWSLTRVAG